MLRVAIQIRREDAELVLAELLELSPAGVEEVDIDEATVEYALYGDPTQLPSQDTLKAATGEAFRDIYTTEIEDDWADRWRDFHKPLVLGQRLSVRPPWEPPQGTDLDLVIDPGRAFGTGSHATTRLCLEALLDLPLPAADGGVTQDAAVPGTQVVDLGCGSGVLGIAAVKLGWQRVLALDYDQLAVDATLENAAVNEVADQFEVEPFDLMTEDVPGAPLVLANLLAPLLISWAERMRPERAFRPNVIILSGVLESEADRVCAAFAGKSYVEDRRLVHGEWAASVLQDSNTR